MGEKRRFRPFGCARITKSDRPLRAIPDSIGGWSGRPGSCRSLWVFTSSRQFVEQRLCLFQIGGVEALGEPAVDRGEEIAGFGAPALLAPQPGEIAAARNSSDFACWACAMRIAC